jgi:hypothetical protein
VFETIIGILKKLPLGTPGHPLILLFAQMIRRERSNSELPKEMGLLRMKGRY